MLKSAALSSPPTATAVLHGSLPSTPVRPWTRSNGAKLRGNWGLLLGGILFNMKPPASQLLCWSEWSWLFQRKSLVSPESHSPFQPGMERNNRVFWQNEYGRYRKIHGEYAKKPWYHSVCIKFLFCQDVYTHPQVALRLDFFVTPQLGSQIGWSKYVIP